MTSHLGNLSPKSLLLVRKSNGRLVLGKVDCLYQSTDLSNGQPIYFLKLMLYRMLSSGSAVCTGLPAYFDFEQAVCCVCYASTSDGCFPRIPIVFKAYL